MNIDPSLYLANKPSSTSQPNSILGKNDFLKLLITQLKDQDPSAPMQSTEFISQMATFTSLEQTQNMSDSIQQFVQSQSNNMLSSQAMMIGKNITWNQSVTDDKGNTNSEEKSGAVASVKMVNGKINYVTTDGENVLPTDLVKISDSTI